MTPGPSTTVTVGGRLKSSQTTLPSAFTPRRYCPDGHVAASRAWTCEVLIWAAPTAPAAILEEVTAPSASSALVIPPVATAIVPVVAIGPPVSPAPVTTLVTVPPLLASAPQTTDPSALTVRMYS